MTPQASQNSQTRQSHKQTATLLPQQPTTGHENKQSAHGHLRRRVFRVILGTRSARIVTVRGLLRARNDVVDAQQHDRGLKNKQGERLISKQKN